MPPVGPVSSLSNEELRQALIEYGVNVGPVVASTRKILEKKLQKLIDSGGSPLADKTEEEEEEDEEEQEEEEDEEVEDEEVQIRKPPPTPPRAAPEKKVFIPAMSPVTRTPIIQARRASPTRPATITQRKVPSTQAPKVSSGSGDAGLAKSNKSSSGLSMWIKLMFIIVVAFLVYLVFININPAAENKIPASLESKAGADS